MKKNVMMRIASLLLVAVIVTSCAVSGTFAKYVSTVNGTATASVAKWAFTGNDIDIATDKTFTFDLFATIKDTSDAAEEDVLKDDDKVVKIAPGTSGSFAINLTNASEVNAKYTVDYTVTNNAGLPIEYSANGENWSSTLADITEAVAVDIDDTTSINVYWRWAYETADGDGSVTAGDEADTTDGIAEATNDNSVQLTVVATVTLTQVD